MTKPAHHRDREKGSALIEFALVALVFFFVIFGIVEMTRMMLVYTTLSNAARGGVRYAQVHGKDRTGTGVDGPSTPTSYTNVQDTVKALAGGGSLDLSRLTVTVDYRDSSNAPGSRVQVQATYAYDPFTALPLSFNLNSESEGVITF